jgi:hypothetical protein
VRARACKGTKAAGFLFMLTRRWEEAAQAKGAGERIGCRYDLSFSPPLIMAIVYSFTQPRLCLRYASFSFLFSAGEDGCFLFSLLDFVDSSSGVTVMRTRGPACKGWPTCLSGWELDVLCLFPCFSDLVVSLCHFREENNLKKLLFNFYSNFCGT